MTASDIQGTHDAPDSLSSPFHPNASISGEVRTQDNRPVGNARIEIRDLNTGGSVAVGYTGPSGRFEVGNLPRGNYEIVADSGLSEAREQVRMDGAPMQFSLRLPHTEETALHGGQQMVSVQQLSLPGKAQSAFRKAQESFSKGKFDEARKEIAKALEIAPKYSDAVALRGIVNMQSGNLPAAEDDLQKAIQMDNNNAMAYVAMASVYNLRNQFDDALRELDLGTAIQPKAWQAQFEMSKAHLGKGMFTECLAELNKAKDLLGHEIAAMHIIRGEALFGMKSFPEAASEFQKYLEEDKDSPTAQSVKQALEQAQTAVQDARK